MSGEVILYQTEDERARINLRAAGFAQAQPRGGSAGRCG
jgi:hypothetical protein